MNKVYRILFSLHIFVGIGGMAGGLAAIMNPQSPLGMPVESLKNSPFKDYFIPGVILFTIIGLGNLMSALILHRKTRYQGYISSVFSWALVIWILVQCIMLKAVAFLHILFFVIGLIQAILALSMLFEKELFPTNIIKKIYKSIK